MNVNTDSVQTGTYFFLIKNTAIQIISTRTTIPATAPPMYAPVLSSSSLPVCLSVRDPAGSIQWLVVEIEAT